MEAASWLKRADAVTAAGRRFQRSLSSSDALERKMALTQLENASAYDFMSGFSFSEGAAETPTSDVRADYDLDGVLLELQSGNVLVAAGLSTGEVAGETGSELLDRAVSELSHSQRIFRELGEPATDFGFESADSRETAGHESLAHECEETFELLVNETASVLEEVLKRVLSAARPLLDGALGSLGKFELFQSTGRLVRQGLQKIASAFERLRQLFGIGEIPDLKARCEDLLERAKTGIIARGLEVMFDVAGGMVAVRASVKAAAGKAAQPILMAINDLGALRTRFRKVSKVLKLIASGAALAGLVLPVLGVPHALVAVVAVQLIVAVCAVIVGADYADAPVQINLIRGVRVIAASAAAP